MCSVSIYLERKGWNFYLFLLSIYKVLYLQKVDFQKIQSKPIILNDVIKT